MTRKQHLFLSEFHERLIQPIIDKLDADQKRKHPIVNDPMSIEVANIIRSLKIFVTSNSSFQVEFTCKGDYVMANLKHSSNMEHVVWELHNTLELAELKHVHIPHSSDLVRLRRGVYSILQIIRPEVYGMFHFTHWSPY